MEMECKQCHCTFKIKPSQVKKGGGKFCSRKCYTDWQKIADIKRFDIAGYLKNHPEVVKMNNEKKRGKPAWNKGKKLNYMPAMVFKKGQNSGDKHPRWKGGNIFYWKKLAHKRDNYTCQNCGLREPEIMDLAHIKPIKGNKNRFKVGHKRNKLENLITLCPNCHRRFDKNLITLQF